MTLTPTALAPVEARAWEVWSTEDFTDACSLGAGAGYLVDPPWLRGSFPSAQKRFCCYRL